MCRKRFRQLAGARTEIRVLCAWCTGALGVRVLTGAPIQDVDSYVGAGLLWFFLPGAACFALCTAFSREHPAAERYILPVLLGAYELLLLSDENGALFVLCFSALWALLFFGYARRGWLTIPKRIGGKTSIALLAAAAAGFILTVGGIGVLRYKTFGAWNYDFGIFCQTFASMRRTGLPLNTCERDGAISHFSVHLSPILYLLLPVYCLAPHPETLQLAQAFLLASGCLPLYLTARRLGYTVRAAACFAVLLLLYPAVGNGADYDFHENCFLLPLLLWTFYFYERDKTTLCAVFAVLTLLVKEDAFVYVAFFALYCFFEAKRRRFALLLFCVACIWFLFSVFWLGVFGEGAMFSRYSNYIGSFGGAAGAVKTVLFDPGYVFSQLPLDQKDGAEKLTFLLQLLAPLSFLPLCVKKYERLILLLPMVLVNLMTLYTYQYSMHYQYAFGSAAFMLYLALLNGRSLPYKTLRPALLTAFAVSISLFVTTGVFQLKGYLEDYRANRPVYEEMEAYLESVPRELSVACSSGLAAHLADREILYEDYYHEAGSDEKLDLVILDTTREHTAESEKFRALGYQEETRVKCGGRTLLLVLTKQE